MTEKFSDYLLGTQVNVVIDNNPLCYILKNAKLDATGHRWLASLSLYDFQLRYKKGSLHSDADLLSRRPLNPPEEDEAYKDSLEKIAFLVEKAKSFDENASQNLSSISQASIQSILLVHGIVTTKAHSCGVSVRIGDRTDAQSEG